MTINTKRLFAAIDDTDERADYPKTDALMTILGRWIKKQKLSDAHALTAAVMQALCEAEEETEGWNGDYAEGQAHGDAWHVAVSIDKRKDEATIKMYQRLKD